jgi:hypothetical protein
MTTAEQNRHDRFVATQSLLADVARGTRERAHALQQRRGSLGARSWWNQFVVWDGRGHERIARWHTGLPRWVATLGGRAIGPLTANG